MTSEMQHLISMIIYMGAVIGIGLYFAKRANKNSETYFLGGRTLGPWVSAFSAEASDMSGWLLMGLPGLAYWTGIADAGWTAIGLFVGTYFNWLIVSRRLRRYSEKVDAITLPGFFSKRFHEKSKIILIISSLFITLFFTVYAGQCLASCGKLFVNLFGLDYHVMMIIAAVFVLIYTILGGFLAESASDFMQAIVMIVSLSAILILAVVAAGGMSNVIQNSQGIEGFFSLFETATPNANGGFGDAKGFSFISILSALAWGLGYFGMPQVLLRFMGIRSEKELTRSRRVACIWLFIAMTVAVFIGIVGRSFADLSYASNAESEAIFIDLATKFLPPILAGFACAGILAASISSSDSYLLISTSAIAENIYHGIFKKDATDKQVMWASRIAMAVITIIAMVIAWDSNSTIFGITSFAWAGFGATFGPLMLFSLFWKRTTHLGAICGMATGAVTVFVWKLVLNPLGGIWSVYCLLPAFILSSLVILVVSLLTKKPSNEIIEEFESVKNAKKEKIAEEA